MSPNFLLHYGLCTVVSLVLLSCVITGHGYFGGHGFGHGLGGSIYSHRVIGNHHKFGVHSFINKTALCLVKGGTCETDPATCASGVVKFNCDAGSLCCFNSTFRHLVFITKVFGKGKRRKGYRRRW